MLNLKEEYTICIYTESSDRFYLGVVTQCKKSELEKVPTNFMNHFYLSEIKFRKQNPTDQLSKKKGMPSSKSSNN